MSSITRWRILLTFCRWQLLVGRCPQCGWPRFGFRSNDTWRSWPNAEQPLVGSLDQEETR